MCGIGGIIGTEPNAALLALEIAERLSERGVHGAGVAGIEASSTKITVRKKAGLLTKDDVLRFTFPTHVAISHTRWATHGNSTERNAHPHMSPDGRFAVAQNGTVDNFEPLREELVRGGYTFVSETDTEVICYLIHQAVGQGHKLETAVQRTMLRLEGNNSIVVLSFDDQAIIAASQGSSLTIGRNSQHVAISSTVMAMRDVNQVYYVDKGLMVSARDKGRNTQLFRISDMEPMPISWESFSSTAKDAHKGNYPHWMLKEINNQPEALHTAAMYLEKRVNAVVKNLGSPLYFLGSGTGYNAALAGSFYFNTIARFLSEAKSGPDFLYQVGLLPKGASIFVLSQSGETKDVLKPLEDAPDGVLINAITNNPLSQLGRMAEVVVPMTCGEEKSVAATMTFTNEVAILFLIAQKLAGRYQEGKAELLRCADEISQLLTPEYKAQYLDEALKHLLTLQDLILLGRGISFVSAEEAALKITEVCNIAAEAFNAGNFKHGPLARIKPGKICMVFVPAHGHPEHDITLTAIRELKANGAVIFAVSPEENALFDRHFKIPNLGDLSVIAESVVMQLLAYYWAVGLGLNPDLPPGLAKAVTVD